MLALRYVSASHEGRWGGGGGGGQWGDCVIAVLPNAILLHHVCSLRLHVCGVAVSNVCVPNVPLHPDSVLQCLFRMTYFPARIREQNSSRSTHLISGRCPFCRSRPHVFYASPFVCFVCACVRVLPFFFASVRHTITLKRKGRGGGRGGGEKQSIRLLPWPCYQGDSEILSMSRGPCFHGNPYEWERAQ